MTCHTRSCTSEIYYNLPKYNVSTIHPWPLLVPSVQMECDELVGDWLGIYGKLVDSQKKATNCTGGTMSHTIMFVCSVHVGVT